MKKLNIGRQFSNSNFKFQNEIFKVLVKESEQKKMERFPIFMR